MLTVYNRFKVLIGSRGLGKERGNSKLHSMFGLLHMLLNKTNNKKTQACISHN